MPSFFEELGRNTGRWLRKARWLGQELLGTEDEALEAEYRVGRDLAEALSADLPEGQKPADDASVEACGQRLVACLKKRKRRFRFQVLPGREVNAFALPGGFIYITQPLLELCVADRSPDARTAAGGSAREGEAPAEPVALRGSAGALPSQVLGESGFDRVAFVLGHEMGHVLRSHVKDRIMGNSLLSLLLSAAPGGSALQQGLRQLARQLVRSDYSQDQELEADAIGVKLLRLAGLDPTAACRVLELLRTQRPSETALDSYFASHPPFATRLANIERVLKA